MVVFGETCIPLGKDEVWSSIDWLAAGKPTALAYAARTIICPLDHGYLPFPLNRDGTVAATFRSLNRPYSFVRSLSDVEAIGLLIFDLLSYGDFPGHISQK